MMIVEMGSGFALLAEDWADMSDESASLDLDEPVATCARCGGRLVIDDTSDVVYCEEDSDHYRTDVNMFDDSKCYGCGCECVETNLLSCKQKGHSICPYCNCLLVGSGEDNDEDDGSCECGCDQGGED